MAWLLLGWLAAVVAVEGTPLQFFYDSTTVASEAVADGGCRVRTWNGTDVWGLTGPPWLTTIDCDDVSSFDDAGVADGPLSFYLAYGSADFDSSTAGLLLQHYYESLDLPYWRQHARPGGVTVLLR
mmetsp:Transcript_1837/g.4673  ORF Transcript_1837/g.4673 Transcript_1837/m.4673 type:complete len:126 (-) Transcript_1837:41-418(-)